MTIRTSATGCRTCTQCQVTLHDSYFSKRTRTGADCKNGICKACMRERWRKWNTKRRGGLRGYSKANRLCGSPWEVAEAIARYAENLGPEVEGVRVYRKGPEVLFWHGALKPPKDAEFLGLYDFEATLEMIAEDIAA